MQPEVDYIVVGSGSSGSVVASRLSETASRSVLLLEAGLADDNPAIKDPAGWFAVWQTNSNWGYRTVPQERCDGRSFALTQGRALGGSGVLNGMVYTRGHRSDFDAWAYAGNPGWDYQSALTYFKKSEDFEGGASDYRGTGGPLRVSLNHHANPVSLTALEAMKELGFPETQDHNGKQLDGVGLCQLLIKDGQRHGAQSAFLTAALARSNLKVVTGAVARRLLFEGTRCVGVEYSVDGDIRVARAGQEVIVCAGALASPRLLMLSGIGPANELRTLKIPVVADLIGVGRNLHDHLFVPVVYEATRPTPAPRTNGLEVQMFWRSDGRLLGPDLHLMVKHAPIYYDEGFTGPENGISLNAGFVRTASRGTVRLTSNDPDSPAQIDPGYLVAGADMQSLLTSLEVCREIGMAKVFDEWRGQELLPGPNARSADALTAYVRRAVQSGHHHVGTCKMGVDALCVVDPELRVHGVEGLRVADASIMPTIPSAGTNAATIMIAEKAADMIKTS